MFVYFVTILHFDEAFTLMLSIYIEYDNEAENNSPSNTNNASNHNTTSQRYRQISMFLYGRIVSADAVKCN